ncbi:MAG: 2-oxoglutarate dehydrogenase E1 component [Myxococcales bacterium]|nr:2-oxoglutarate dehydrogenase E1 component [Myxococcales bacterium]
MIPDSLLSGENAGFLDDLYRQWLREPSAVEPVWQRMFEEMDKDGTDPRFEGPTVVPRSIFAAGAVASSVDQAAALRQAKVVQLINAYRVRAHLDADIDPLGRRERRQHEELTLEFYGLTSSDLDETVESAPAFGLPPRVSLRRLIDHLRSAYCSSIGAEFMNIMDNEQKEWVQEQLETLPNRGVLNPQEERRVFRKLCDAENFERMLHGRFPGTKRFSLEGGETLVPLLDLVVNQAATSGVDEIVVGMAHRGRLNTLVNILGKPARLVVREFEDVGGTTQGSGDVKYHLGYSADLDVGGSQIHLSLTPNPSHLEAVNAVVQGRVRAKQRRARDTERRRILPVLLHGDAAFSGQGSVMETLNLSELQGYATGGTVHIIVNNQIGFTTPPAEGRSTPYATDIARMLAIPIFHVNGEVPRDVAAVTQMALAYRQRFQRDVVIDMYCYRKHGHNEGDEPSFTQPAMYEVIRGKPSPREVYAAHLVRIGTLTPAECDSIYQASFDAMKAAAEERETPAPTPRRPVDLKEEDPDVGTYFDVDGEAAVPADPTVRDESAMKGIWSRYSGGSIRDEVDTRFDRDRLVGLLRQANTLPESFTAHRKIRRLLAQRTEVVEGKRPVDWAVGEQAAFATLMADGYGVRLSGQDSGRGTFSHRHAVVTDVETGEERYPLQHLGLKAPFRAIDSSLSELAVLGFEVGYALDSPDVLVLWEAQFGDFANGAQMIIDQYMAASEQKWGRYLGLVLLLPHGYEGQGPEHSSARLERFLQLCAEDNMQVANCTTPANLHHLLRRQMLRNVRAPLVLMTPKSLLRHPQATSTIDELAQGRFHPVLGEADDLQEVRRVVLCSGKVYFELLDARRSQDRADVALVRVEQLYPFPEQAIRHELQRWPGAEVVWCQEEPKNMGAWPTLLHRWLDVMSGIDIRYVGRRAAASPATGSHRKHLSEQTALVAAALE